MYMVYKKRNYCIYKENKTTFIIYNMNKDFKDGHTHINNYHTAKTILKLVANKELPKKKSKYILNSMIRISNNKSFINKLKSYL